VNKGSVFLSFHRPFGDFVKLGTRGSFYLVWMVAVVLLGVSGLGLLGLLRHWRFLVEDQLRLNQRVGSCVLDLQKKIEQVEFLNATIRKLRVAILASSLRPELLMGYRVALKTAVFSQEAIRIQWEVLGWKWRVAGSGDQVSGFPGFPWVRDPPDIVGEQSLRLTVHPRFRLGVYHAPRVAVAELYLEESEWKARWVSPEWVYESVRTNFF